jgi:hypothetical protein
MIGKSLDEIVAGCNCQTVRGLYELVSQRCMGEIYQMTTVNGTGESLLLSLTMVPLTSQTGRESGVVLVLRDERQERVTP